MKESTFYLVTVILTGVGMIFCFAAWCETRYATVGTVQELKVEVDALYNKLIPQSERAAK